MRKVINISIPEPCHEDWSKMTPKEKGRHCTLCKKTVFDFTTQTDEYIVDTFTKNEAICGRFKSTQLQRDLVFSRKEKNSYLSFVASGVFAFLGLYSQKSFSQGQPRTIKIDTIEHNSIKGKVAPQPKRVTDSISGVIMSSDKYPLPGATVIIKGTTKGAVTNFDGEFSIKARADDVLLITYLGYESKEVKVTDDFSKIVLVELNEDVLGGVVIIAGYAASSCSTEYIPTPEEALERQKQIDFARNNGSTFYKRLKKERRDKIKNGTIERSGLGKFFYSISNLFR
ncbi:MAG: carboxypeptidase-like regulatory domain-containing protein [Algibacter sp.]